MLVATELGIERVIEEGEVGYIVSYPTGERKFNYTLEEALTRIASDLTGQQQIVMVL